MDCSAENLQLSLKGNTVFTEGEDDQIMQQILMDQSQARRVIRRKINGANIVRNRRAKKVLMKNRKVIKRVRTLKKLVPNTESMGIEGLFEETADYILALQMRVRVMQIMVKVLTGNSDE